MFLVIRPPDENKYANVGCLKLRVKSVDQHNCMSVCIGLLKTPGCGWVWLTLLAWCYSSIAKIVSYLQSFDTASNSLSSIYLPPGSHGMLARATQQCWPAWRGYGAAFSFSTWDRSWLQMPRSSLFSAAAADSWAFICILPILCGMPVSIFIQSQRRGSAPPYIHPRALFL